MAIHASNIYFVQKSLIHHAFNEGGYISKVAPKSYEFDNYSHSKTDQCCNNIVCKNINYIKLKFQRRNYSFAFINTVCPKTKHINQK